MIGCFTVGQGNGWLSQRWLSAADSGVTGVRRVGRQSGHCYLAGRSKLSLQISAVMPEENTSHQRIFIQQRVEERSEPQKNPKSPSVTAIMISGNVGGVWGLGS